MHILVCVQYDEIVRAWLISETIKESVVELAEKVNKLDSQYRPRHVQYQRLRLRRRDRRRGVNVLCDC